MALTLLLLLFVPYLLALWVLDQFVGLTTPYIFACFGVSLAVTLPLMPYIRRRVTSATVDWARKRMATAYWTQQFKASEQGFEIASSLFETKGKWAFVQDILETPAHLILRVGPMNAFAIPKAAFGDTAAQAAAVTQVRAWWAPHKAEA